MTSAQESQLMAAIQSAESATSGEVRIHLEKTCRGDASQRAQHWFKALKMHRTDARNGILFYLALESHQFAVWGDQGIHQAVGQNFWSGIRDNMIPVLQTGDWAKALCAGIATAGDALAEHFPHAGDDDVNELSDEITKS